MRATTDRRTEYPRTDYDDVVDSGMRAAMLAIAVASIVAAVLYLLATTAPADPSYEHPPITSTTTEVSPQH